MGKSDIPKDWFLVADTNAGRKRISSAIEKKKVASVEELPKLVTVAEAAEILKSSPKTIHDWMAKKLLKSVKLQKHRFTTPQWIQDFIDQQLEKHG